MLNIEELEQKYKIKILMISEYGSKLYKTDTPNSDTDYKGIFIPINSKDIILHKYPQTIDLDTSKDKNTKDDIDFTLYSLEHYFKNLNECQTWALELLFSNSLIHNTREWDTLKSLDLVTYNMKATLAYVKSQYYKYANKSKRYEDIMNILNLGYSNSTLLKEIPEISKYSFRIFKNLKVYTIANLEFTETIKFGQLKKTLNHHLNNLSHRSIEAAQNNGIDWKATHHAIRILTQTKLLLQNGSFSYPLPNNDYLMKIKFGKINFEECSQEFEKLYNEIQSINVEQKEIDFDSLLYILLQKFNISNLIN